MMQEKIINDKKLLSETISVLSISTDIKLIRLRININNVAQPLKIIFKTKTEAVSLLSSLGKAKRNHVPFPARIKFV